QREKEPAPPPGQTARRSGAVPLPAQSIKVECAVHASVASASGGVWTSNDPLEEKNASYRGEDSHQVEEELAQHQGHLPLLDRALSGVTRAPVVFARPSSRDFMFNVVRRGFDSSVTSGRVIAD